MVNFTDKEIKKLARGSIKDIGPDAISGLSCVIKEDNTKVYRLRYRIKGEQECWRSIGEWASETSEADGEYEVVDIRARAKKIKRFGSQGIDYLRQEEPVIAGRPIPLRNKLKEFFDTILFDTEETQGLKLKWMDDKTRLAYMPPRAPDDSVNKQRKRLKGKKEPRYKDWKVSRDNPQKYPAILDRDHYWAYVGMYNNWIAGSSIKIKFKPKDKGTKLMNVDYNRIPTDVWPKLHKEITNGRSKNVANDTLEMLRVFYYWLINNKDKYIEENPITESMSRKTTGPQKVKQDDGGTWHEVKREEKEGLEDHQIDALLATIEEELIQEPKGPVDRMRNRSLLFIVFRLVTGARPDVATHLTWAMLDNKKKIINVESKSRNYQLRVSAARSLVFDRIKELKSTEKGHPFVFAGYNAAGEQIGVKKITKLWRTIAKKAGIKEGEHFYNLKHTAFSTLVRITGDVIYAADCCGISAKTATEKYHLPAEETLQNKITNHYKPKLKLVVNK
jgi:integrase